MGKGECFPITLHQYLANSSDSSTIIPDETSKETQMKRIISHFMGNISFDLASLESIADNLEQRHEDDRNLSINSQNPVAVNDYSLDPLSTNAMRENLSICIKRAVLIFTTRLLRGVLPLEFFKNARASTAKLRRPC